MATTFPSDLSKLERSVISIDISLDRAKRMLVDAEWNEEEEVIRSLRSEIERLERLKALGETHDVPW